MLFKVIEISNEVNKTSNEATELSNEEQFKCT